MLMIRSRFWLVAALVAVSSVPAWGVTVVPPTYSYYPVSGNSPSEIYLALMKRGPVVDGARALASTSAVAEQDGGLTQGPSACQVTNYQMKLSFVIKLPRIQNESVLAADDRQLWRQFSVFLKSHELEHTKLWVGCARELETKVTTIRARSCADVSRQASALWKKLIANCDKRQNAFDAEQRTELLDQPFMRKVLRSSANARN